MEARNHHGTFGEDPFGRWAERGARFFGTPQYIVGQTIVVVIWIVLNSVALIAHWDPYPFILLNLAFSTQAAYAAPLILLAETRQTERDRRSNESMERHHEEQAESAARRERALAEGVARLEELVRANTELTRQDKELTEQVAALTREVHARLGRAN